MASGAAKANKVPRLGNVEETNRIAQPTSVGSNAGASPRAIGAAVQSKKTHITEGGGNSGGNQLTTDNQYFFEDQVFRLDRKGRVKFGLVIETPDSFSGDEEDDFDDLLKPGEVRVAWHPGGTEEVNHERKLGLADRTLMPGDVVRRMVPGADTQRGYCREIDMHADIKVVGSKYVIKNVDAKRLRLIGAWHRDSAVWLDSWVGSVDDVEEKAILKSTSGARVEISSGDFFMFKDATSRFSHGIFSPQVIYPGNYVSGRLPLHAKLLTPNIPLPKNKKGKYNTAKYYVESVRTENVVVHWQCKALSDDEGQTADMITQPHSLVTGDDLKRLKRLNLFEACMLQINDRTYFKFAQTDSIVKKSQWDKEQSEKFKLIFDKQQKEENQNFFISNISNSSNPNHHDKMKKRSSLDMEKVTKTKKGIVLKNGKDKPKSDNNASTNTTSNSNGHNAIGEQSKKPIAAAPAPAPPPDAEWESDEESSSSSHDELTTTTTTTTTASSASSPSPRPPLKHGHSVKIRPSKMKVKSFKKSTAPLKPAKSDILPKDGTELVTETLLVYSRATVVWQDGTVEENIPSTDLYPIHHLDNNVNALMQEFFPGDFVSLSRDDESVAKYRDYGVVQKVDHIGRTALVKWFTTYASNDEPYPTYNGETEVSVYDLKDHPDFQYRPGTMVIRVANFVGEDAKRTAGQIIDNYPEGRVKVSWVEGNESMCWPQDLFEVNQQDAGDWGGESESESWETESENSEIGGITTITGATGVASAVAVTDADSSAGNDENAAANIANPKMSVAESQLLSNIERARVSIARLEELFRTNANFQSADVMRKLLSVYKGCRFLDRLMNTDFFHENHFMGLIERVRKVNSQSMLERAQDRKNRLFNQSQLNSNLDSALSNPASPVGQIHPSMCRTDTNQVCYQAILSLRGPHSITSNSNATIPNEYAPKVLYNFTSTPAKASAFYSSICWVNGSTGAGTGTSAGSGSVATGAICSVDCGNGGCGSGSNNSTNADTGNSSRSTSSNATNCANNLKRKNSNIAATVPNMANGAVHNADAETLDKCENSNINVSIEVTSTSAPSNEEQDELLDSALQSIVKVYEDGDALSKSTLLSKHDSGNFSRTDNLTDSCASSIEPSAEEEPVEATKPSVSNNSFIIVEEPPEQACTRLCALLKTQLMKCIEEIRERFFKDDSNLNESTGLTVDSSKSKANKDIVSPDVDMDEQSDMKLADNGVGRELATSTSTPATPITSLPIASPDQFQMLSTAPLNHKYHMTIFQPNNPRQYYRAIQREHRMLKTSLPPGVWVRVFEDRMDLLSVLMEGPKNTPYEDAMFLFDIQLGKDYPSHPPQCYYISYCTDRLNPNLYEDGKVCVSLLGTWTGRDTEVWGPNSTLLQVIVSIQGLILVPEPYFNEAGYERQKDTQEGAKNSRMYNEMAIIKVVQASSKIMQNVPGLFSTEIERHFKTFGRQMHDRLKSWITLSKLIKHEQVEEAELARIAAELNYPLPGFPLLPGSRGFCITLAGLLEAFETKLQALENAANLVDENK